MPSARQVLTVSLALAGWGCSADSLPSSLDAHGGGTVDASGGGGDGDGGNGDLGDPFSGKPCTFSITLPPPNEASSVRNGPCSVGVGTPGPKGQWISFVSRYVVDLPPAPHFGLDFQYAGDLTPRSYTPGDLGTDPFSAVLVYYVDDLITRHYFRGPTAIALTLLTVVPNPDSIPPNHTHGTFDSELVNDPEKTHLKIHIDF